MDDAYDIGIVYSCGCEFWLFPPGCDDLVSEAVVCESVETCSSREG